MAPRLADPALEVLWKQVLDHWNDEATHGVFLEHCRATDQLLEAAVRYRGMSADRDRGVIARKRLQVVTLLALAKLEMARSTTRESRSRVASLLLVLFFTAASVALGLYALR